MPPGSEFAMFELGTAIENLVSMCIPKSAGQALRTLEILGSPPACDTSRLNREF